MAETHGEGRVGTMIANDRCIEELPFDAIADILSRAPTKSLLRFKCVCKQWLSLIGSPNFHKRRLLNGWIPKKTLVASSSFGGIQVLEYDDETHCWRVSARNFPSCEYANKVRPFASCNGFLLVSLESKGWPNNLVWNPLTQEYKFLYDVRNLPGVGFYHDAYADEYKVVAFQCHPIYAVIHNLKSKTMEVVTESLPLGFCCCSRFSMHGGIEFKGIIYWLIIKDHHHDNTMNTDMVIAYDIKEKKFSEVLLPHDYRCAHHQRTSNIFLDIFEEHLAVFSCYMGSHVDVWVFHETEEKNQHWSRKMSIPIPHSNLLYTGNERDQKIYVYDSLKSKFDIVESIPIKEQLQLLFGSYMIEETLMSPCGLVSEQR